MARLNHPNLIGVYDFGDADGLPFIIMEMVNGKSLHHSAYGRAIDPIQAGTLVSAISRGLAHAHEAGILHRDIKPGNILLDAEARPKVGDFGLAQPIDQKTGDDDAIYGTPGYTAPEVYHRQGDHRADIFSVGILLHELLIGKLPEPGSPPPSTICGCSREMDNIVARATNPNPAMRYDSAEKLADDLDKAIANRSAGSSTSRLVMPSAPPMPVRVARAAATPSTPATPAVGSTQPQPASSALNRAKLQAHSQKKSPALLIGIICGLLALVAIIVIASSGGGGEEEKKEPEVPAWKKPTPTPETGSKDDKPSVGDPEPTGRDRKDRRDKKPKRPKDNGNKPEVVAAKPSPLDSLARLKPELAAGARENFPDGAEARGGSHFVVADLAMTWRAAKKFAEEHGAHLAVLPTAEDRSWFAEKFPTEEPLWLGAGMAAGDKWQWLDESDWDGDSGVSAETPGQRFVSMLPGGVLSARADEEILHVALQWRDDGSNPATTAEQLKRTTEHVKESGIAAARYPVGTRTYGDSHFLNIANNSISWDDARKLANFAGGYLAVPSDEAEAVWIAEAFGHLGAADRTLWMGGFRIKDGNWQWLSREAWNHNTGWAGGEEPASSPDARLVQSFGEGGSWLASDGKSGGASGFLIEWSPPKQKATIASFDLEDWLEEIDERYTDLIEADIAAWDKENKLIIDRYVRNIERLGRKYKSALVGREGKDRIREAIDDAVREVTKNEKLLSEIPSVAPDEFHDLQKKSEESIKENDDELEQKLKGHLAKYTQELAKQIAGLTQNGFDAAATALAERSTLVADNPFEFLKILGLTDPSGRAVAPEVEEEEEEEDEDEEE